ncbi:MAG: hypothetical protein WC467_03410 [Patescibacteria group bacterium]
MAHEIEADYIADWGNEATQCRHCTSFSLGEGQYYCSESKTEVPPNGHCDFFQAVD